MTSLQEEVAKMKGSTITIKKMLRQNQNYRQDKFVKLAKQEGGLFKIFLSVKKFKKNETTHCSTSVFLFPKQKIPELSTVKSAFFLEPVHTFYFH